MTLTDEQKAERARARRHKEALAAEAEHERREARNREWEANRTRLTREELQAGMPCRGCGLPVIDGLGDWPFPRDRTPEVQAQHDAAEADYKARHGGCNAHSWGMSGSRALHCGWCCPPPPLSRARIDQLVSLLSRPTDPRDLSIWRLYLTCDHMVDRAQHRSHDRWSSLSVVACPDCGRDRGVVTAERLLDEPADIGDADGQRRLRSAASAADLAAAKRELAKLERESKKLQERIEAVQLTAGG